MADYFKRIQVQANKYEEVTDDEGPFIKIINVGERIVIHRIEGQQEIRDEIGARYCGTDENGTAGRDRLLADAMLFLFDEHPQPTPNDLLCQGEPGDHRKYFVQQLNPAASSTRPQSGQSLIEHSYKADSDLSPAGWEYAERLKAAVMSRRKQVMEERREAGEEDLSETKLRIWTSARRRAHHTAWPFVQSGYKVTQKPQMAEINP